MGAYPHTHTAVPVFHTPSHTKTCVGAIDQNGHPIDYHSPSCSSRTSPPPHTHTAVPHSSHLMATLLIITHLVAHPEHERGTAVQAVHDGADTAGALTPDLWRIVWKGSVKRVWHKPYTTVPIQPDPLHQTWGQMCELNLRGSVAIRVALPPPPTPPPPLPAWVM